MALDARESLYRHGWEARALQAKSTSGLGVRTTEELFRRVERAKQEWEATADAIPDFICLVDSSGTIVRVNRTVEVWGLASVTRAPGRSLHALLHPDCNGSECYLHGLLRRLPDVIFRGQVLREEAYDPHLKRYIHATAHPLDPAAKAKNVHHATAVIVLRDVTEQARLMDQLRKANEALQVALKAKKEMILYVSHELRTPLTLIEGYLSLLRERALGSLTPEQVEALNVMSEGAQRLLRQINRLLALQEVEAEPPQKMKIDMAALVQWVARTWEPRVRDAGLTLKVEVRHSPVMVQADMGMIQRALDELLDNAIKFNRSGGSVWVRVWREGNEARVCVQNEGRGIPGHVLPHLFQHFLQVHGGLNREAGGMGIGLALCHKVVEVHGGRIWAESEGEERGATFHIALPLQG